MEILAKKEKQGRILRGHLIKEEAKQGERKKVEKEGGKGKRKKGRKEKKKEIGYKYL